MRKTLKPLRDGHSIKPERKVKWQLSKITM